ncbi:MAG TPA: hypothetical protein VGN52_16175 [Burkholderiales bacterium]
MLQAGKGLSPAFMKLLEAIAPETTITFDELAEAFPAMDADDLELWLAELCRMELISPAEPPGVGLREVHLELAEVTPPPAPEVKTTGRNKALKNTDKTLTLDKTPKSAPRSAKTVPAMPVLPPSNHAVSVLLVDKSPEERELWRQALEPLPINLFEAGTLAEADSGFREHKPQAVVMGMTGVDFKALHLIGLLKHPRNRTRTKVFLMLEDKTVSQSDLRTAQMADATIQIGEYARLLEEVAQQLQLEVPAPEPAPAKPAKDQLSVTQRLLYAAASPEAAIVTDPGLLSSLEQRYPRVTLELVERWGKPSLEGFLDNLILDSRGNRQGFAPEAMEELLLLYSVHREYRPANEFWYLNAEAQSRAGKSDKMAQTGAPIKRSR